MGQEKGWHQALVIEEVLKRRGPVGCDQLRVGHLLWAGKGDHAGLIHPMCCQ